MNKINHFEIPADNIERAKKFYKDTFGWTIEDVPKMEYHIIHSAKTDKSGMVQEMGAINGGIMKRKAPLMCPIITITVKDINETIEKIKKSGGKAILSKREVGEMGWSAYFEDSERNVMGLWQSSMKNP